MEDLRWDKDRLYQLVQEKLGDYLFLVVSNREPYIHTISGDKVKCNRPVSGLTEALDPVMRASKGTPNLSRVSAVWHMVGQSDWLPMMMATAGFSVISRPPFGFGAGQKKGGEYSHAPSAGKVLIC